MSDFNALVRTIKECSIEANNASKPVIVVFGTVTSESPLKVKLDMNGSLEIDQDHLVLTRTVTDYNTDMTVDHLVENRAGGTKCASFQSHNHKYTGRKQFLVHHKLLAGDKVVMLRVQGGQRYVILDRVV